MTVNGEIWRKSNRKHKQLIKHADRTKAAFHLP